jgi:hypothetical protein
MDVRDMLQGFLDAALADDKDVEQASESSPRILTDKLI